MFICYHLEAPRAALSVDVVEIRPDKVVLNVSELEKTDDLEITGYSIEFNGKIHDFESGMLLL